MIQSAQLLLFLVISVLTAILTACGIQIYYVLKELRESVKKVNKILDDAGIVSSSVAKPIAGISGFITGLKSGAEIVKILKGEKEA
jgi:hypothetical protein